MAPVRVQITEASLRAGPSAVIRPAVVADAFFAGAELFEQGLDLGVSFLTAFGRFGAPAVFHDILFIGIHVPLTLFRLLDRI